jgi:hypothetical protein
MKLTGFLLAALVVHGAVVPLGKYLIVVCWCLSNNSAARRQELSDLVWGALLAITPSHSAIKVEKEFKPTVSRKGMTIKRRKFTYGPYPIKGTAVWI